MDARITKEETALLMNLTPSRSAQELEAIRLAAIRARDEAIGRAIARGVSALWRGIRAAALFILDYPRRRALFEQLSAMSDRELADIGLQRADLARVFDEDFRIRQPAEPAPAAAHPVAQATAQKAAAARPEAANSNLPEGAKAAA
jgi:uncharacterized protein YjiS (DUF1127 family)